MGDYRDIEYYVQDELIKKNQGFKPVQWDGCGCIWYEKGKQRKLVRCELHHKNPRAFGGLLVSLKKGNK